MALFQYFMCVVNVFSIENIFIYVSMSYSLTAADSAAYMRVDMKE